MLKIQRDKGSTGISIRLNKRERALSNKRLWVALGIALTIHFAPLLIFRITGVKLLDSSSQLPPARVRIDSLSETNKVQTHTNQENVKHFTLEAPPKSDELASLSISDFLRRPSPFTPEEPNNQKHSYTPSAVYSKRASPSYQLHLSGPIRAINLKAETLPDAEEVVDRRPLTHHMVRYSIKVDPTDGSIFWFAPISLSSNKRANRLGEKILRKISFESDPNLSFLNGEVGIDIVVKDD